MIRATLRLFNRIVSLCYTLVMRWQFAAWGLRLSRDPQFVEKLTGVVGLYLKPPDKALVLCIDEKS